MFSSGNESLKNVQKIDNDKLRIFIASYLAKIFVRYLHYSSTHAMQIYIGTYSTLKIKIHVYGND